MLRGILTTLLLTLNLILWGTLVMLVGLLKLVTRRELRRRVVLALAGLGDHWAAANNAIFRLMLPVKFDVEVPAALYHDGHYLIFSNHISWVDIFLVFHAFHGRAAFIRFFMKRELIWMPVVGLACWALEFPFMRRYTAEYLARHPEKRGTDLETTRRVCRRYRKVPVAILNFLEGTRFSEEKHADQESPYAHLLRPRVGGIAFVLASLGEQLDGVIDVTLAYPGHLITFWEFVSGRVQRATLRARLLDIPPEFLASDITEPGPARDHFKTWIETIWREKDDLLSSLTAPEPAEPRSQERPGTAPE